MILGGILTELNMLNKDERSQMIEIMLLRNRLSYTGTKDITLLSEIKISKMPIMKTI